VRMLASALSLSVLAMILLAQSGIAGESDEKASLASAHLRLQYDLRTGRADISLPNGTALLRGFTAAAVFPRGAALAADACYSRRHRIAECREPAIVGQQLIVDCTDSGKKLDLEHRITLLRDQPGAVFEVVLTNVSKSDVPLCHSEPIRALIAEGADSLFDGQHFYSASKVLTNGYMYYDPGQLLDGWAYGHRNFMSWWNVAVCREDRHAMVVGYLENRQAEGQIIGGWDTARSRPTGKAAMNLTARSLYNQAFTLKPGASISSGRVMLLLSADPFSGLENYAEVCGRLAKVRLNPIINGWCSWFYTYGNSTEDEQVKNAEFIAKHLKPYGLEWVQMDDGYQRSRGDWDGNARFPHGMKWLAQRIRKLGLKAGIWVAPFVISKNTEVALKHRDWLLRDTDGSLFLTPDGVYCLDVTHPQARQWLYDLFHKMAEDWGYDFFKIDFVEWSLLAAQRYHDPTVTRAAAYRLGIETIRKAIGPNRHLLDCGPPEITLGLIDSVRIELDQGTDWSQYTAHFNSTAPAMANRYYHHRRTWINDADHLGVGHMAPVQAQAAASILALSGGTMILADRLYALDAERLAILRKVLPTYGESARPLDLFEKTSPEIFALPVHKDFEKWWLLGYFNYDSTATKVRAVDLATLGLDPKKRYLAYEFWSQRLYEPTGLRLELHWAPASVQLLGIREKTGAPQVLGTDRHYTQGGIELQQVRWDAASDTLSGVALGGRGTQWTLAVFVPEKYTFDRAANDLASDAVAVRSAPETPRLLRVAFNFQVGERIPWTLKFHQ
jgi:hypothetical protein